MPRWLVYSLLTIACWGVWGVLGNAPSDLSAGQSQAYSTLGLVPVMLAVSLAPGFSGLWRAWRGCGWSFLAGALVGVGNACYYAAVALAKTATTVSFTMLYPIVTVLLALAVLREKPRPAQWAGIAGSLGAIALLGVARPDRPAEAGWLAYAAACILLWGVAALIMKIATHDASAAQSTFWFLAAFVPLAAWILIQQPAYFIPADRPIRWNPSAVDWLVVLAIGATFGLGNLTLLSAYRHGGKASVVTPLTGLYPVVTIPLAIGFYRESISRSEWAGIVLALVSAVCLMLEPKAAAAQPAAESQVASD